MKNYKVQTFIACCGACEFKLDVPHYGLYCIKNIGDPINPTYNNYIHGNDYKRFKKWTNDRLIDCNGISDDFKMK